MHEWAVGADPSALVAIATEAGPTQKSKRLSIGSDLRMPIPPVEAASVELLEALFLEDSIPVAVFGTKVAEPVALRLLTAVWPSMRRRFTMSTFCNSPRTIAKKSFDLVFAPVEARSRFSDWKGRRVDGTKASPPRHRWSSKVADEVFRAPYPSLSSLDVFGEMADDEIGSEEALRLSLLWSELAGKVATEPHAALGLLDIANTRSSRRTVLVTDLVPVLTKAAESAALTMPPAEAWRFLQVLISKLGEAHWRLLLINSVRSLTLSLAQQYPVDAVDAISHRLKDGSEGLLNDIASGIAKASAFEMAAKKLAVLPPDLLLHTVLAAPELSTRLLHEDYGIEPGLVASIGGASKDEIAMARKRFLPHLVNNRHAKLFAVLLENADGGSIAREAERLSSTHGLTAGALNEVLVDVAQQENAIASLRDVVTKANPSHASHVMLRKLLRCNIEDVDWILTTMESSDARRATLLLDVLTTASDQELRPIFGPPEILAKVLKTIGDLPAATEILARIVENIPLPPTDLIALAMRVLPRIDGPRAGLIAVTALEAALPGDFKGKRDQILSTFFDRAGERLDGARILRLGAGRGVHGDLASSNLVLFDNSPASIRNKFLKSPTALADTIIGRGSLDLSYAAGEAVGRLLWGSDEFDHPGFLFASARLLPFVTDMKAEAASPIIAAAFPSVYRELQRESPPDFLSYVFLFVDWDRCKVARRALVRALLNSNWRPRDIALAAARAGDAARIIRNIAKEERGSFAISSIEREADTIPDPWKEQVKKALKDLRKDPVRNNFPSDL